MGQLDSNVTGYANVALLNCKTYGRAKVLFVLKINIDKY